jgi:hypothetical protein
MVITVTIGQQQQMMDSVPCHFFFPCVSGTQYCGYTAYTFKAGSLATTLWLVLVVVLGT